MQVCKIRVRATQEVIIAHSYGMGWVTATGVFYHKSKAKLIKVMENRK